MAQLLAPVAELRLGVRFETLCVLDERAQLGEPLLQLLLAQPQLLVAPSRRQQLAPGGACVGPEGVVLRERVEHVELECRPRQATLLELPGHRDQALRGGGDVLARSGAAPRVRARPAVLEDPPCEQDVRLVFRAELLDHLTQGLAPALELRLHERLCSRRPDHRRVAAAAEQ